MFEIVVSCRGTSEQAALIHFADILDEFKERPWHQVLSCTWEQKAILLRAQNDYDSSGLALLDEFSDVICACLPIEDSTISFAVESVVKVSG
jgi:hypothetical protein